MVVLLLLLLLLHVVYRTGGTELTFELPDKANQCFYEELKEGTKAIIDYQVCATLSVITGCDTFI